MYGDYTRLFSINFNIFFTFFNVVLYNSLCIESTVATYINRNTSVFNNSNNNWHLYKNMPYIIK